MHQKIISLLLCFLFFSNINAQRKFISSEFAKKILEKRKNYSQVNIKLDGEVNLEKIFLESQAERRGDILVYRDSTGNFLVPKGEYEIKIWLDENVIIYFSEKIKVGEGEKIKLNFKNKKFEKEINAAEMLVNQIQKSDTLIWLQKSDNNWWFQFDTLKIFYRNNEKILQWKSHKKNSKINNEIEKEIVIDKKLADKLFETESIFYYENGPQKTEFKYCGNCQGTASHQLLKLGKYKKEYQEPTCSNIYWINFRKEILGAF